MFANVPEESECCEEAAARGEGNGEEFSNEASFDVRNPFRTERRGLHIAVCPGLPKAEAPVSSDRAELGKPCKVGFKGKGRPVKMDDIG